jgi:hypothetical protein
MIRVGDEETVGFRVGQQFAGKGQRQIADLRAFQS